MKTMAKWMGGAALVSLALSSAAQAGGYQRGQADIDILFEPGNFATRAGVTYVNPRRGFESVTITPGTPVGTPGTVETGNFGDYTGNYIIPSYSVMFGGDMGACAGSYTESFAAEADYSSLPGGATPTPAGNPAASRTRYQYFDSNELSVNCRVSYNMERGRVSVIGGLYIEDFNFEGSSLTPLGGGAFGQVDVDMRGGYQTGFRLGAAYEIPEIALRAQIVYRSEVEHDDVSGSAIITGPLGPITPPGGLPASLNNTTSPQSLNINVQTGIAEGTLLLGSFRWTDWSSNEVAVISLGGAPASVTPFNWRDGYTASLGIGRAFNENISGLVAIGYDRGVSTGSDTTYTDLYTLSGGVALRNGFGELRLGGLVGYWTDGEQSIDRGANFDATVGDDWVLGANASLKIAF